MNQATENPTSDGLVGSILREKFRLEIWKMNRDEGGEYFYITKIKPDGTIGRQSVGFSDYEIYELIELLTMAGDKNGTIEPHKAPISPAKPFNPSKDMKSSGVITGTNYKPGLETEALPWD